MEGPIEIYYAEDTIINLDASMQDPLTGAEPSTYKVRWEHNKYIIGTKPIYFNNGKVIFDKMDYPVAEGLLQLSTYKNPTNYNEDDLKNYGNILDESDAIYQGGNRPIDKNSAKWENSVRTIWEKLNPERARSAESKKAQRQTGEGINFLPSDPNALIKRFQLLLSSVQSGNTGIVQSEIVAILDELLRMKHIDREEYKSIFSRV